MKSERELMKAAAAAMGVYVWWTPGYGGRFLRMRTCPVIWDPWRVEIAANDLGGEDATRRAIVMAVVEGVKQ